MTVVQTLRASPERACGTFPVEVAPRASTLTHHFRVLREAGIIRRRETAIAGGPRCAPRTSRPGSPACLTRS